MGDNLEQPADQHEPTTYRIRIAGQLDARWAAWFDGLTITLDEGDTLLTGAVVDQAALHGLLRRVRDLGLPLVSIGPVGVGGVPASTSTTTRDIGRRTPVTGRSAASTGEKG